MKIIDEIVNKYNGKIDYQVLDREVKVSIIMLIKKLIDRIIAKTNRIIAFFAQPLFLCYDELRKNRREESYEYSKEDN